MSFPQFVQHPRNTNSMDSLNSLNSIILVSLYNGDTMEVDWKVDPELTRLGWNGLNDVPREVSANMRDLNTIVDVGGGSGSFGNYARAEHPEARVICIDLSPRITPNGVQHVKGSGLELPFKDSSVDLVTVHAMLHHVPDQLSMALEEVKRILRPGGYVIIQEPLDGNPLANMARKKITTTHHDEDEIPLSSAKLEALARNYFQVERVDHHFIYFYLMPHIVPRVPGFLRGAVRSVSRGLFRLDRRLLMKEKGKKKAAYINIVAINEI